MLGDEIPMRYVTYKIIVGQGAVNTVKTQKAGRGHGSEKDCVIASLEVASHLRVAEGKDVARILVEGTACVKPLGWEQPAYQNVCSKAIGCGE